jgi:hypothetical protein
VSHQVFSNNLFLQVFSRFFICLIMFSLPADIILHILALLPLSDICLLLQSQQSQYFRDLTKQVLLSRVKHQRWTLAVLAPHAYFALLCNRDIMTSTTNQLVCVGYNSRLEYLRFESIAGAALFDLSPDEELEFQSMRLYCSQWIKPYKEHDRRGQIKLVWRPGEHSKTVNEDLCIRYHCSLSADLDKCGFCKENSRCNKHAFTSTSTCLKTRRFEIKSIRVSLDWLRQGLVV